MSNEGAPSSRPPQGAEGLDPAYCLGEGLYEFENFLARYRRLGKGAFEDWQIVSAVASSIYSMLKKGRNCPAVERLIVDVVTKRLDEAGIDRRAVHRAYLHGIDDRVLSILDEVFPRLSPLSAPTSQLSVGTSRGASVAPSYTPVGIIKRAEPPTERNMPSSQDDQRIPLKQNRRGKVSSALAILFIILVVLIGMLTVINWFPRSQQQAATTSITNVSVNAINAPVVNITIPFTTTPVSVTVIPVNITLTGVITVTSVSAVTISVTTIPATVTTIPIAVTTTATTTVVVANVTPAWVKQFIDIVNDERMSEGAAPLQYCVALGQFAQLRFETIAEMPDIFLYGFNESFYQFFSGVQGINIREIEFFIQSDETPSQYASMVERYAPLIWGNLTNAQMAYYGWYGGIMEFPHCNGGISQFIEIPAGVNITQYFLNRGCSSVSMEPTYVLVVEEANQCPGG